MVNRIACLLVLATLSTQVEAEETLGLSTALARAFIYSPELSVAAAEVGIKAGIRQQTALYPNPEFLIDAEDFGGNQDFGGINQAQITYILSQEIELWGKRARRQALAAFEETAAHWDYQLAWLKLRADVTHAIVEAAILQERRKVAQDLLSMAKELLRTVQASVESGKVPPMALYREEINMTSARLKLQQIEDRLRSAYQQIASYWGDSCPDFTTVLYDLDAVCPPQELCELFALIELHPSVARWNSQIAAAHNGLDLEKKVPLPDITVTGGFRQYPKQDAYSFVAAIDFPLPLWDWNQGNISRARHELSGAISQREAARADLKRRLTGLYNELNTLHHGLNEMRHVVLHSSEEALSLAKQGYEGGKFAYYELLDARRAFFDLREQYLENLLSYHHKRADLDQLLVEVDE